MPITDNSTIQANPSNIAGKTPLYANYLGIVSNDGLTVSSMGSKPHLHSHFRTPILGAGAATLLCPWKHRVNRLDLWQISSCWSPLFRLRG